MVEGTRSENEIELPRPTAAPLILALGIVLLGAGVVLSTAIMIVGGCISCIGLGLWLGQFAPGSGHMKETVVPTSPTAEPIAPSVGTVEQLRPHMPGYRLRLPLHVHPISAGLKGGLVGGALMPIPALLWGLLSGHGIWYPINLLAGMVAPGVAAMSTAELEQFRPLLFFGAIVIHVVLSAVLGLLYGVLLPTLPPIHGGKFYWGGLIMPLLWTGASYGLMGVVNPLLEQRVDWPWFVVSQFVFGVAAAIVVMRSEKIAIPPAGMGPDTESLTR